MKILITGGAGFIGATIATACSDAGHVPVVLDDFSTGARAFVRGRIWYEGDIADASVLERIAREHPDIHVVVHCAAYIVVPDSVEQPLRYYRNNVGKTIEMLQHLERLGLTRLLFSSSASIYLPGEDFTVDEQSAVDAGSPYAATKWMVERVLRDACATGRFSAVSLRYFNPIGADPECRTGLQLGRPSHALGKLLEADAEGTPFAVTGVEWPTRDGSAIRDYIHVWDLARAHVRAVERFDAIVQASDGYDVINVGTGNGTTVRELLAAYERATGRTIDTIEAPPRPGDVLGSFTRVEKARQLLDWSAEYDIESAIRHAVQWAAIREQVLSTR